uniref:Uncharacterized protein n=1 Tax=Vitis vinifera TaxID=29760 RepID=A5ARK2_VITVI|nr:hypothetical protein VITISV_000541 [Vitis vinifera]
MSVANIGMLKEPFRKRKWCLRDFADTQEGLRNHFATKGYIRRAAKLASILRFSAVQKGCEITSQQKGDFATLCKMLPSTWSDWLAMAATSSFQLRIEHRLKHWILDFLSFEIMGLPLQLVLQMGPEALLDESVALLEWKWRAQQLVAGRNEGGAALRWQCVELEWPTSALGML